MFSVYRKPQFTDISISNFSLHPTAQKFSSIHSDIHRLLRLRLNSTYYEHWNRNLCHCAVGQIEWSPDQHKEAHKTGARASFPILFPIINALRKNWPKLKYLRVSNPLALHKNYSAHKIYLGLRSFSKRKISHVYCYSLKLVEP